MRLIRRFESSALEWRAGLRRAKPIVFCVGAGICVGFVLGLLIHARLSRTEIKA